MDGGILVDGTTIDNDEGVVTLEYLGMRPHTNYTLRYDLYDHELLQNDELEEDEDRSNSQTFCRLPFVTQQLLIMDKRLAKQRVTRYNKEEDQAFELEKGGIRCDFSKLNNTEDLNYGEDGFFCH